MVEPMEYEPTSEDIDRALEANPAALERLAPQTEMRVHVEVPLDHATLEVLQAQADREGRPFAEVVSDAVRAGAAAA